MLHDLPVLAVPAVNVGEACLHGRAVCEGEGIDTGVDRDVAEGADVGFVDDALGALGEECDEVVFDFFVVVADLVGYSRQQNCVGLIKSSNVLGLSSLEGRVPLVEEGGDVGSIHCGLVRKVKAISQFDFMCLSSLSHRVFWGSAVNCIGGWLGALRGF